MNDAIDESYCEMTQGLANQLHCMPVSCEPVK
jgi:hypothetical protein